MDTLEEIYHNCLLTLPSSDIPKSIIEDITAVANKCQKQKGVYTVLVTLLYYKYLHPTQDIRYHQAQLENGFSGRTFDTNYVTPTLKKLGLPAMAEIKAIDLLKLLLQKVNEITQQSKIVITPLLDKEKLTIATIMQSLQEHFLFNYGTHNFSKTSSLGFLLSLFNTNERTKKIRKLHFISSFKPYCL